jgi:hypothetical protein
MLGLLFVIPYIAPVRQEQLGRWFPRSGRAVQVITGLIGLTILLLTFIAWMAI